jgi:hypothetical protein
MRRVQEASQRNGDYIRWQIISIQMIVFMLIRRDWHLCLSTKRYFSRLRPQLCEIRVSLCGNQNEIGSPLEWPAPSQSIHGTNLIDSQNTVSVTPSELGSSWDCFFGTNPCCTWADIHEKPILIPHNKIAETNVRLCFQNLEKCFCIVDWFRPKRFCENVEDPFEMTTWKTMELGHVFPDHDSWNLQVLTQLS